MALGWRGQYLRYREYFLNIAMLYKQRRDLKMFLEIILSLTTVTIFSLFALKPTALTIIALVKEIREKEKTVALLDQKITNLDIANGVYSEVFDIIPIINSAIPNEPQPETFVKKVQEIASINSVQVLGVSVGEITLLGKIETKKKQGSLKPLPPNSKEVSISISLSGTYPGIIATIQALENSRRPMKIDSIGINSSSGTSGNVIVAIITGRVPYIGGVQ